MFYVYETTMGETLMAFPFSLFKTDQLDQDLNFSN